MNMTNKSTRQKISENFLPLWPDFLLMNIVRTQKLNTLIGNPIDGQIMQIICWHHLLCQKEQGMLFDSKIFPTNSYLITTKQPNHTLHIKKLTISSISISTDIPFETTRRRIQKLAERDWIIVSKKQGVIFKDTPQNNETIFSPLFTEEKKLMGIMLNKFADKLEIIEWVSPSPPNS